MSPLLEMLLSRDAAIPRAAPFSHP
ncbi:conserved hypothetical protein [Brucella ovis ATCC 25840]|uniref:Uncharacterized protein n=1 Tax=Brucella ovis (strain ATCC 25840 / 63/290 / NCTC 10512) TaxID=444178 RepID=A0A0H3APS6_BRUO2|nr:conserved hypothetical protein [Brucella ovis ATCC 25840]